MDKKRELCDIASRILHVAHECSKEEGEWIWLGDKGDSRYMCSVCHCKENVPTVMGEPTVWGFCPNCGARVVRGDKDENGT